MSIVLIGGNKCMERRYLDTCKKYGCKAKVFNQMKGELRKKIGSPDLIVLFSNSASHKMVNCAICEAKRCKASVKRCHDSINALESLLGEVQEVEMM